MLKDIIFPSYLKPFLKLYYLIALTIIIFFIGVIGYATIEGYSFLDAAYMTIITVSTVGYGEVQQLSPSGKIFTVFLIVISFGSIAYAISAITSFVADGYLRKNFKIFITTSRIKKMENHVIICGLGRNGKQASIRLKMNNQPYVIVEKDEAVIKGNIDDDKELYIEGDAVIDETLILAGIKSAKALITTLPSDADNIYVILSAKQLNPSITIISRAIEDEAVSKLKTAGAEHIIMPDKFGGAHMASLVIYPDVVEFLDNVLVQEHIETNLVEIKYSNLPDSLKNKTLKELHLREKTGANIIGFKTPTGEHVINPEPNTQLIEHSKLFVLGSPSQIKKLKEIFNDGNV